MTPKEKAKELIRKYMEIDLQPFSDYGHYIEKDVAKECALIAVDEILNWPQVLDTVRISKDVNEFYVRPSRYWTEVKQEIEKL